MGTTGYQGYTLEFRHPASQTLGFRVHFTGQVDLWVERIVVASQRPEA